MPGHAAPHLAKPSASAQDILVSIVGPDPQRPPFPFGRHVGAAHFALLIDLQVGRARERLDGIVELEGLLVEGEPRERSDVGAESQAQSVGKSHAPTKIAAEPTRRLQTSLLRHSDACIGQETVTALLPQPDAAVLGRGALDPRDRRLDGLPRLWLPVMRERGLQPEIALTTGEPNRERLFRALG